MREVSEQLQPAVAAAFADQTDLRIGQFAFAFTAAANVLIRFLQNDHEFAVGLDIANVLDVGVHAAGLL